MTSLGSAGPETAARRSGRGCPPATASHDFAAIAELFAVLANPTRVRLMWLLGQQEYDVTSLTEAADVSMSTVSHHLAKLRQAQLVSSRYVGRHHLYHAGGNPRVDALVLRAIAAHS